MMFKLIVLLVSMASVLHRTTGMHCVLCIDVKSNLSAAHNVKNFQTYIDKISNLRKPECVNANTNAANTNLLSCKTSSDQQRDQTCGTINGEVVLRQGYFEVDIPTTVIISGCLYVENGTDAECYTDLNMLNENREILVNFLNEEIGILPMQTGNFTKGQICIIRPPYETRGNEEVMNKSAPIATGYGKNTSVISKFKFLLTLSTILVYFAVL
ncbi:uncharacterized protein LOC127714664 [Mytilus californianus]|uniref:uncharacterized protein LOC127714664 n=1 Tax=Mytilus californianus TaxID=6549 RepID=UPI0022480D45|nr:uncharacterized protein LOC127714664 [Mytilus californianus]